MAFEVLASKAYGSANFHLLGLYYKRAQIVLFIILIFFFCLTFFTKEIFLILGQHEVLAEMIQEYVIYVFPGICCLGIFSLRAIFFNSQYLYAVPMIIQIITTGLHFVWCSLFYEYQVKGIAYAMNITLFINMIAIELFNLIFNPRKKSYAPWSLEVFKELKSYVFLTTPIAMTTFLEEFSYEINSIVAGLLQSDVILAAHVALAHSGSLFYCLPEGFSAALNSFVGMAIGEKKQYKSKRFALMGVTGGLVIITISSLFLWIFKMNWALYFTENTDVVNILIDFLPLFILNTFLDALQLTLGAIIKVVGKGKIALILYFVCLYIIANPLSYFLGIVMNMGLLGIWLGVIIGVSLLSIVFFIMVLKIKWEKEVILMSLIEERNLSKTIK